LSDKSGSGKKCINSMKTALIACKFDDKCDLQAMRESYRTARNFLCEHFNSTKGDKSFEDIGVGCCVNTLADESLPDDEVVDPDCDSTGDGVLDGHFDENGVCQDEDIDEDDGKCGLTACWNFKEGAAAGYDNKQFDIVYDGVRRVVQGTINAEMKIATMCLKTDPGYNLKYQSNSTAADGTVTSTDWARPPLKCLQQSDCSNLEFILDGYKDLPAFTAEANARSKKGKRRDLSYRENMKRLTREDFFGTLDLGEKDDVGSQGSYGSASSGFLLPDGDSTCPVTVENAVNKGLCPAGDWTDQLAMKVYEFTAMVCS